MYKLERALVLLMPVFCLSGCSSNPDGTDGGHLSDFAVANDLAMSTGIPDLLGDQSIPLDQTMAGMPTDLAISSDLAALSVKDLATSSGMVDLIMPPDLAPMTWDVSVGANNMNAFVPQALTIRVGDTVRWTWYADKIDNLVSGVGGVADNKFCAPFNMGCANAPLLPIKSVFEHTFNAAGSYPYFCSAFFNAGMTGTITVN